MGTLQLNTHLHASRVARMVSCAVVAVFCLASNLSAKEQDVAFKINDKSVSAEDLIKAHQGQFYEIEKQKYELIERLAKERYLDSHWETLGKKSNKTAEQARDEYLKKNTKVSEAEIKDALEKFKDHPRLKELPEKEKRQQIVDYLQGMKSRDVVEAILDEANKTKKLVISYPKPSEPIFDVPAFDQHDPVKYGPKTTDVKPMGCEGSACAITVIEYSEFQCPFCSRVQPATVKLLGEYKGKVRWIVRDFPLSFHDRAKPAAVVARCAQDQGKYWEMYETLFENQRALGDSDFESYGKKIGLNMDKFKACINDPKDKLALIDKMFSSGEKLGVTGTPAFFINGRRLSGALPYEEFKKIFEEEMAKKGKKS